MNKTLKLLSGVLALFMLVCGKAHAGGLSQAATGGTTINYTTTVTTITQHPAYVYGVIMSTGASAEFIALCDSNVVTGITSATATQGVLKARLFYGSTTANTVTKFEPPLKFQNGIIAAPSAVTGQAVILWAQGQEGY